MKLGVSVRPEWLVNWETLGLDRFQCYEIVPYVSFSQRDILQELIQRTNHGEVYLHLTSVSVCDDPEYFVDDTQHVIELSRRENVVGVSLHHGLGVYQGARSVNVLPVPDSEEMRSRARKNLAFLRSHVRVPIALEHLSLNVSLVSAREYYAGYSAVAQESGCDLVVDYSNLWATGRNHGLDPLSTLRDWQSLNVAYSHWGGSYLGADGQYYDTHHEFRSSPEIMSYISASARKRPLVFELDGGLADFARSQEQLNRFIDAFKS